MKYPGGGFGTRRGSAMKQAILSCLENSSATSQELHAMLCEQWDLDQVKNSLLKMRHDLQVSKNGHGKAAIYSIIHLGKEYLKEASKESSNEPK